MTRAFSKTIRRGRGGGRFNRSTGRQPLTGRAVAGLAAAGLGGSGQLSSWARTTERPLRFQAS